MKPPKGYFSAEGYSGYNKRFKASGEFRPPKKGEFYLSGAIIEAYRAPNDLTTEYWIAIPVRTKTIEIEETA
jgi:hypothetical protein